MSLDRQKWTSLNSSDLNAVSSKRTTAFEAHEREWLHIDIAELTHEGHRRFLFAARGVMSGLIFESVHPYPGASQAAPFIKEVVAHWRSVHRRVEGVRTHQDIAFYSASFKQACRSLGIAHQFDSLDTSAGRRKLEQHLRQRTRR